MLQPQSNYIVPKSHLAPERIYNFSGLGHWVSESPKWRRWMAFKQAKQVASVLSDCPALRDCWKYIRCFDDITRSTRAKIEQKLSSHACCASLFSPK